MEGLNYLIRIARNLFVYIFLRLPQRENKCKQFLTLVSFWILTVLIMYFLQGYFNVTSPEHKQFWYFQDVKAWHSLSASLKTVSFSLNHFTLTIPGLSIAGAATTQVIPRVTARSNAFTDHILLCQLCQETLTQMFMMLCQLSGGTQHWWGAGEECLWCQENQIRDGSTVLTQCDCTQRALFILYRQWPQKLAAPTLLLHWVHC